MYVLLFVCKGLNVWKIGFVVYFWKIIILIWYGCYLFDIVGFVKICVILVDVVFGRGLIV